MGVGDGPNRKLIVQEKISKKMYAQEEEAKNSFIDPNNYSQPSKGKKWRNYSSSLSPFSIDHTSE